MQIKNYWVGDRPGGTWVFQVLDQTTGTVLDLSGYSSAKVVMLDPKNQPITIAGSNTVISDPVNGKVTFFWPNDSLFNRAGRYVMQVELDSGTAIRKTTVQEILVRELGGVTN
jgi:hypothetical protein